MSEAAQSFVWVAVVFTMSSVGYSLGNRLLLLRPSGGVDTYRDTDKRMVAGRRLLTYLPLPLKPARALAAMLLLVCWVGVLLPAQAVAQENDFLLVEVVTARAEPIERRFESTGEVVARDAISLSFPIGGRVKEVLVEAGARVEAGQLLAKLDATQQQQALSSAEAGLATTIADARQAADDFARADALLASGAMTRVQRGDAESVARAADAAVIQAQSAVQSAQKALADMNLAAPVAGQVTVRTIEPGQVVAGAQTAFEMAGGATFDAVFNIPEALLTRSRKPPPVVSMRLIEGDHTPFAGHVREVSPQIDPATGTVAITVGIDGTPEGLVYGASVRGSVALAGAPRISLPASALTGTAGGAAVWIVENGSDRVALRPVSVLRHVNGFVILDDGVNDGDRVVAHGAHLMFPGRPVAAAAYK